MAPARRLLPRSRLCITRRCMQCWNPQPQKNDTRLNTPRPPSSDPAPPLELPSQWTPPYKMASLLAMLRQDTPRLASSLTPTMVVAAAPQCLGAPKTPVVRPLRPTASPASPKSGTPNRPRCHPHRRPCAQNRLRRLKGEQPKPRPATPVHARSRRPWTFFNALQKRNALKSTSPTSCPKIGNTTTSRRGRRRRRRGARVCAPGACRRVGRTEKVIKCTTW